MRSLRTTWALMVALALVLAACGGGGGDTTTTAAAAPATTEPAAEETTPPETTGTTAAPVEPGGTEGDITVGVSWNNYNEERWARWDEPAIRAAIEEVGGR